VAASLTQELKSASRRKQLTPVTREVHIKIAPKSIIGHATPNNGVGETVFSGTYLPRNMSPMKEEFISHQVASQPVSPVQDQQALSSYMEVKNSLPV
jgi:hypothetical protein